MYSLFDVIIIIIFLFYLMWAIVEIITSLE